MIIFWRRPSSRLHAASLSVWESESGRESESERGGGGGEEQAERKKEKRRRKRGEVGGAGKFSQDFSLGTNPILILNTSFHPNNPPKVTRGAVGFSCMNLWRTRSVHYNLVSGLLACLFLMNFGIRACGLMGKRPSRLCLNSDLPLYHWLGVCIRPAIAQNRYLPYMGGL